MKKKLAIILLMALIWSLSCQINGSFQGLYGYYHKTKRGDPQLIRKPFAPICALNQDSAAFVYAISGDLLNECIGNFDKCLIYIWRPNCSSTICIDPMALQEQCDYGKIELFVVAEYYSLEKMKQIRKLNRPVFGVDCDAYENQRTNRYMPRFLKEAIGSSADVDFRNHFFSFTLKTGA